MKISTFVPCSYLHNSSDHLNSFTSQTWVKSLLYPALWYPIPPSEAIRVVVALGASEVVLARWTMGLSGLQSSSTMPDILFDFQSLRQSFWLLVQFRVSVKEMNAAASANLWFLLDIVLCKSASPFKNVEAFTWWNVQCTRIIFPSRNLHTSKHYDASLIELILF